MGEGLQGEREGLKMCRSQEHWGMGAGGIDCFVISKESALHSRKPSLSSESVVMG